MAISSEFDQCARCKKASPGTDLGRLCRFGMSVMALGHIQLPDEEQAKVYCHECRELLNRCIGFLAVLAVLALVISIIAVLV